MNLDKRNKYSNTGLCFSDLWLRSNISRDLSFYNTTYLYLSFCVSGVQAQLIWAFRFKVSQSCDQDISQEAQMGTLRFQAYMMLAEFSSLEAVGQAASR